MRYKGVIFDLDGTILDSIPLWSKVGERFLLSQGILPPPLLKKELKKKSLRQAAQYFIDTFQLDFTADEVIEKINRSIEFEYKNTIQAKDYVVEFLSYLHDIGIKMCIATLSNKKLAESALDRLDILHYFDFVLTSDDVGAGKDHPDIYIQAAKLLSCKISETLVFEDSPHCIETAKAAGFDVVGVYEGSARDRVERMQRVSDHFIYSFQELDYLTSLFE